MSNGCPNWDLDTWAATDDYNQSYSRLLQSVWGRASSGRFADLGCGRGLLTQAFAATLTPPGIIIGVDPCAEFPEPSGDGRVSLMRQDALDFISSQADGSFQGVLMKQMLHLLPPENREALLAEVLRTLEKGGSAVIFQMPRTPTIPLFRRVKEAFLQLDFTAVEAASLATGLGFDCQWSQSSYQVSLSKERYFQMIRRRFISDLKPFDDNEIEEGIAEIDAEFGGGREFTFNDSLDVLRLTKKFG